MSSSLLTLQFSLFISLRRERDSNPRYRCRYYGFQDRRIRPLCHPSNLNAKKLPYAPVAHRQKLLSTTFYTIPKEENTTQYMMDMITSIPYTCSHAFGRQKSLNIYKHATYPDDVSYFLRVPVLCLGLKSTRPSWFSN